MAFAVTYRNAKGERVSETFEAADKSALFKQLSERGISAISISEGAAPVRRSPGGLRGVVAGLVVVVGTAAAMWFMFRGSEAEAPRVEKQHHAGTIADNGDKAVKSVPEPVETNKVEKKPEGPKPIRWAKGFKNAAIDDEGRIYFVPRPGHKLVTNGLHRAKAKYEIFKYHYQNELAAYLTAPPGSQFVGERTYSDSFIKEVVETMSLPIEDGEKDTPEQRALREDMRAVMQKLKSEVDAGNDVAELFKETRKELQDLGVYKQTLEQEFRKIYSDAEMTDDDVDIALKSVNKMLEDKGIAPLQFNKITREVLRHGHDIESSNEQEQ